MGCADPRIEGLVYSMRVLGFTKQRSGLIVNVAYLLRRGERMSKNIVMHSQYTFEPTSA